MERNTKRVYGFATDKEYTDALIRIWHLMELEYLSEQEGMELNELADKANEYENVYIL